MFAKLLEKGLEIDFNAQAGFWGESAFHLACKKGHFEMVEFLIMNSTKLKVPFCQEIVVPQKAKYFDEI